jgi:hypothetical protein
MGEAMCRWWWCGLRLFLELFSNESGLEAELELRFGCAEERLVDLRLIGV